MLNRRPERDELRLQRVELPHDLVFAEAQRFRRKFVVHDGRLYGIRRPRSRAAERYTIVRLSNAADEPVSPEP